MPPEPERQELDAAARPDAGAAERGLQAGQDGDREQDLQDRDVDARAARRRRPRRAPTRAGTGRRRLSPGRRRPRRRARSPRPGQPRHPSRDRRLAMGERGDEQSPGERRRQRGDAMQLEPDSGSPLIVRPGQERPRRGRLDAERQHPKGEAPLEPAERAPDEHRHRQRQAGEAGDDWEQGPDGQAGQGDAVKAAGASFRPRNVGAEVPCPSPRMWRPLSVAECLET